MVSYYPYNPISDIEVSETLTVKNSRVLLRHIPKENSIKIRGFVEVDSTVLVPYQFHCAYSTETHYREANRIIDSAQNNADSIIQEALSTARMILMEIAKLSNEASGVKNDMQTKVDEIQKALDDFIIPETVDSEWLKN